MNFETRTGSAGGAGFLRTAVLFAMSVGATALFASLIAHDADARSGSSKSGSSSSSGSKPSVSSKSGSKSGSSPGSGLKYKTKKHKDCDEDDGCFDDQSGRSDGSATVGWIVAILVLGVIGVGVVGVGTVGYVGWRLFRGPSAREGRRYQ